MNIYFRVLVAVGLIFFSNRSFSHESYIGLNQEQVANLVGEVLGGGMWGDNFAVAIRLISGNANIFLIEFYKESGQQPGSDKRRASRTTDHLDFKLASDEKISDAVSFRCLDGKTSVIGVFKKSLAKEKGRFQASRAWKVDETTKKIVPLASVRSVSCDWYRNGDEEFPKNL